MSEPGTGWSLIVEEGLARDPIEQEHVTRLRHLGHGVDLLAVASDGDEVRIDRQIVIPEVMTQRLEVPGPLARPGVEGDRAIREQVVAVSVAAVEVERGRSEAGEDQAAIHVDAEPAPGVRPTPVLPGVARPRLVPELARPRDGVESPDLCAGADVERPDVPRRGDARPFVRTKLRR